MQKLRPEQMAAFDQHAKTVFHKHLAEFLRDELPDETQKLDDGALEAQIKASEARALKRGIVSDSGIAQWCCLSLVVGQDFDQIPEVDELFSRPDPDRTSEDKLDELVDLLADDD